MAKTPAPVRVEAPEGVPDMVAAVSVALGLMKLTKVNNWFQVALSTHALVELDDAQAAMLRRHAAILPRLSIVPTITVAVCTGCQRFQFCLSSSSLPKNCPLTRGCRGGKLVKAKAAPRAKKAKPAT